MMCGTMSNAIGRAVPLIYGVGLAQSNDGGDGLGVVRFALFSRNRKPLWHLAIFERTADGAEAQVQRRHDDHIEHR